MTSRPNLDKLLPELDRLIAEATDVPTPWLASKSTDEPNASVLRAAMANGALHMAIQLLEAELESPPADWEPLPQLAEDRRRLLVGLMQLRSLDEGLFGWIPGPAGERLSGDLRKNKARLVQLHEQLLAQIAEHIEQGVASGYAEGKLAVQEVAQLLGCDVPDALVRLEERGAAPSLAVLRLSDAERTAAVAALHKDFQARKGRVIQTEEQVRRSVIASERIEGIDSRRW